MNRLGAAFLVLLATLAALLPRATIAEWQGTEARRVQIAVEMQQSGDLLVPTLGREATLAKPPLFYWSLVGLFELFGVSHLVARLPSVLGFFLLALVVQRSAGWLAALLVLASPPLLNGGATAEIDPMFSALTALSILRLGVALEAKGQTPFLQAGVLGGLAILTKGPPYFLFLAGPAWIWARQHRFRGLIAFLVPLLAVPLAYYGPLLALRVDPADFMRIASEESVGRLKFFGLEHLRSIPGYLVGLVVLCMPGLALALAAPRPLETRLLARVCGAAAISGMALLLLFPGRATRYLLPAYALANIALAPRVAAFVAAGGALPRRLCAALRAIAAAAAAGLGALPLVAHPAVPRVLPLLALLALLLPLVRSRATLLAAALGFAIAGAWALAGSRFAQGARVLELAAPELRRFVESRGVGPGLATLGHFPSAVSLGAALILPGHERDVRAHGEPYLLYEDPDRDVDFAIEELPEYVPLLRLRVTDKTLVLAKRWP